MRRNRRLELAKTEKETIGKTGVGGAGKYEPLRPPARGGDLFGSRAMPESLAAEAALLGSMIVGPECISEVVEQVKTNAFYRIEHQMIFDALISLYEKSRTEDVALDAVLLRDELEKRKHLAEVGGVKYIA